MCQEECFGSVPDPRACNLSHRLGDLIVMMVAVLTGGIASFAAIWLVVVPLEAALSASRRVVAERRSIAR